MTHVKNTQLNHTIQGSFLLELLLAFAIISIAMIVVVDSFLSSQRSYNVIAEQGALTKSLAVVLENMSHEARVSGSFRCTITGSVPCSSTSEFDMTHIVGLNGQGPNEDVSYTVTAGGVVEKNGVEMTPPGIEVTNFNVRIIGTPQEQVQALITLTARSTDNPDVKVYLQTSFTEREY